MYFALPQDSSQRLQSPQVSMLAKPFKHSMANSDKLFFDHHQKKKIKAIPILYGKMDQKEYQSVLHKTFGIRYHKFLSQVIAVGPFTDQNLKRINRSSLKLVRKLEFDAYLCDSSGIKSLSETLKKIRMTIKDLHLIIRRVEKLNEPNLLTPELRRIRGMKKFVIKYAGELNMNGDGVRSLGKGIQKFYSLKSIEIELPYILDFEQKHCKSISGVFEKLPKLENLKYSVQAYDCVHNHLPNIKNSVPNISHLKTVAFRSFIKSNWTSMNDGARQFLIDLISSFPGRINPHTFKHQFHNFVVSSEALEELGRSLPQLDKLRHLFLEFSNSEISEIDLMVFAHVIKGCTQIEHLTFKNNGQRFFPAIICQFVRSIAALSFLTKFDLFFRKLSYNQVERSTIINALSGIENIEFTLTLESLHVSRKAMKDQD